MRRKHFGLEFGDLVLQLFENFSFLVFPLNFFFVVADLVSARVFSLLKGLRSRVTFVGLASHVYDEAVFLLVLFIVIDIVVYLRSLNQLTF